MTTLTRVPADPSDPRKRTTLREWLMAETAEGAGKQTGPHGLADQHHRKTWWQVMCLTGVDYFLS
ncbi:MAG: hypothetical protein J7474_09175, partial [Arthrobacter sp.]|nr:hypothetical protein [Arthrobacter sp.]